MNNSIFSSFNSDLFDPHKFNSNISDYSDLDIQIEHLKKMLIIRYAEEKISDKIVEGVIKCPCHLGIGQEAIPVGISSFLNKSDSIFGAHRSHSHFLALNNDVLSLFAETLGRVDGCSNGMGGSMHLIDTKNGFYGSVPIVGATIPIAVGAGFSHKLDRKNNISVSYFGDGATEEGVFHESLNLAKVNNLPVLFVCENNLFSSHMHILERQPELSTLRYSKAHSIPSLIVDGNDISAVYVASKMAIEKIRSGEGPFFIEFITYRWKGHVGPSDDNDVGLKRNKDLSIWKNRDPINRLKINLKKNHNLSDNDLKKVDSDIKKSINKSWNDALNSPYPTKDILFKTIYSQ